MRRSLAESRGLLWQLLLSGVMKGGGGLLAFACFMFIARAASPGESASQSPVSRAEPSKSAGIEGARPRGCKGRFRKPVAS